MKRDYQLVSPTTPEGQVTLSSMRSLLHEALDPLTIELEQVKEKLSEVTIVKQKIDCMEQKIEHLESKLSFSELKRNELEEKVTELEFYSRKNNLKFLNIKDPHSTTHEDCEAKILEKCARHEISIEAREIEGAHRLGGRKKGD